VRPWTQLSASQCTVHVRWMSFVDHVDHSAPRAPRRWTTARPRKGTTPSWGRLGSGCPVVGSTRVYWPGCHRRKITRGVGEYRNGLASNGVGWGGAAYAAAQPATGGESRQSHRRWFGWLEQEYQILKKQHGCWINIQWSLLLESFVD